MINVLFAARPERWKTYEAPLRHALAEAGIKAHLAQDIAPEEVDYIVYAPNSDLQDFTPYTRAKAVLNLWAGVEKITGNETLKIPLARMVDPGLTHGHGRVGDGPRAALSSGNGRAYREPDARVATVTRRRWRTSATW